MEKTGEEIMEYHSLQTVEARTRVGIGRKERMSSTRSELKWVISVVIWGLEEEKAREMEREGCRGEKGWDSEKEGNGGS